MAPSPPLILGGGPYSQSSGNLTLGAHYIVARPRRINNDWGPGQVARSQEQRRTKLQWSLAASGPWLQPVAVCKTPLSLSSFQQSVSPG